MERLTQAQFEEKLKEKYGLDRLYKKRWQNYPNSIFYYPTAEFDGTTANIGIYTNETTYGIGRC